MTEHIKSNYKAIIAMILSTLALSFAAVASQLALKIASTENVIIWRYATTAILLLTGLFSFKRIDLKLNSQFHLLRSLFMVPSQIFLCIALSQLNLAIVMTIWSLSPLFITVIYSYNANKQHRQKIICASIISLLGVAFLMHPSTTSINPYLVLAILAAACNAGSQVTLTKITATDENQHQILLKCYIYGTLCSFILISIFHKFIPSPNHFHHNHIGKLVCILITYGILQIINQGFRQQAYRMSSRPKSLAPYLNLTALFSFIISILLYPHHLSLLELTGISCIIIGCILAAITTTTRRNTCLTPS